MKSVSEQVKVSVDKKILSTSCSSKKGDIYMGRKKSSVVDNKTSRNEHSNKSKVSNADPHKKVISSSSRKGEVLLTHAEKKEKDMGFKNIKKKVIGNTVNDKENRKEISQSKKHINYGQTLKPKGLNTSTPRDNSSSRNKLDFQKTEGDEKSQSNKKLEVHTKSIVKQ
jgi:hypothetical protein